MKLTGHLIFKELVWRSFLQDVQVDNKGTLTCKMHDLMHDLASSVMRHETYILEHDKLLKIPNSLHHLSFDSWLYWEVSDMWSKIELPIDNSLRSIIVHGTSIKIWRQDFSSFLSQQRYLRVLDMNGYLIRKLPNLVCKLEHLRYLVIGCYVMKRLPESLTRLVNLQTLKLVHSEELLQLPKCLKVMKNLWFLDIENFDSLICTPPGLGELVRLRRLSVFIVGGDASHEIHQLKELNLSGELSIKGLDNVRNLDDAKCANLITKKDLTSLTLSWTNDIKKKPAQHFAEVLQGLQPHEDLEKICIKSYQGSVLPNWMSTLALNKLTQITLENCQRCEHLPSFGQLPFLTCLKLHGMDSIIRLNAELHGSGECSFPVLTFLTISNMPGLEEWTIADSVQNFPSLESLTIQLCPKLTGLPKLPSLRTLNISCSSVALLTSITFLTSLTSLKLFDFPELDVFPGGFLQNHKALKDLKLGALPIRTLSNVFGNLPALKTLSLDDCANLEFLPEGLKYLNSLERLDINRCDSLSSFPATMLESLPSLRWLSFQHCKKLIPLTGSMNRAPALQSLLINRLPELEYLPESLQQLSGIRVLKIWDCERLCSLPNWLSSLGSLSEISIRYCEELKSLPDDFNSQKSLRMLEIKGRPQLEMRCNKPMGEDWPKISDIPNIIINHQFIQRQ